MQWLVLSPRSKKVLGLERAALRDILCLCGVHPGVLVSSQGMQIRSTDYTKLLIRVNVCVNICSQLGLAPSFFTDKQYR